jgi:hypothetical protein
MQSLRPVFTILWRMQEIKFLKIQKPKVKVFYLKCASQAKCVVNLCVCSCTFLRFEAHWLLYTPLAETLRSRQLASHSRNLQQFMETEDSLPCLQTPYTDPYPEPD